MYRPVPRMKEILIDRGVGQRSSTLTPVILNDAGTRLPTRALRVALSPLLLFVWRPSLRLVFEPVNENFAEAGSALRVGRSPLKFISTRSHETGIVIKYL